MRSPSFTEEQFAFIAARHEQQVAATVIAWELQCAPRRIRRAFERLGLSPNRVTSFERRSDAKKAIDALHPLSQRALGYIARDNLRTNLALALALSVSDHTAKLHYEALAKAGLIAMRKQGRGTKRQIRLLVPIDLARAMVPKAVIETAAETSQQRKCLNCRDGFSSSWAGERVCKRCKATSTWKTGPDLEASVGW